MGTNTEPDKQGLSPEARVAFEEGLRSRLVEIYSANPWLVASEIDQGAVRLAANIRNAGGQSVLAVGARPGVGAMDESVSLLSLNLPDAGSMIANIHSAHERLADPPSDIQAAVDAWDPDHKARSMCGLTSKEGTIIGRPTFGARPASWLELEDKLLIEELWAAVGIPVSASTQVRLDDLDGLVAAHTRLATELGTVWAVDNSNGWHGGGQGTFWVPDLAAAAEMPNRLAERSYVKVRIMPFLEGVPCSIHGMVLPEQDGMSAAGVAVFRPCEMMMLRDHDAHRLVYGRVSSYWDPAQADRLAMQDTARRIGAELRRRVGFRGVFTVDGVMTADGFLPTEVNTRYGAALSSTMETIDGEPIELFQVHLAMVEGLLDDIDLGPLETWVTTNLDATRRCVGFMPTDSAPDEERTAEIRRNGTGVLRISETTGGSSQSGSDGTVDGDVLVEARWGTAPDGGLIMVEAKNNFPLGPPSAPLLLEILDAIETAWNAGMPTLASARNVR